jgi:nucleoside-diphosphate-sugar epimerase
MKNILIVGGCGYIGSALYLKLKSKHKVDTVDLEWFGNYTNPKNIKIDFNRLNKRLISEYDVVILTAANSSVSLCKDIHDSFDNNVIKFMDLVKKIKSQKFIYASSSCVYTSMSDSPKDETSNLTPLDGLTLTKTTIDHFMPLTGVEYYGLRFGSVNGYSPNMRLDLMINAMTLSALKDKQVLVSNKNAHRPILAINDLCKAVDTIIESKEDKRGIYNLASFNVNIGEVGQRVADLMKVPLIDKGNNFTYDFQMTTNKFEDAYNFKFEDTVESIVNSILDNEINPNWQKREKIQ